MGWEASLGDIANTCNIMNTQSSIVLTQFVAATAPNFRPNIPMYNLSTRIKTQLTVTARFTKMIGQRRRKHDTQSIHTMGSHLGNANTMLRLQTIHRHMHASSTV
jgi:hypothetical protein